MSATGCDVSVQQGGDHAPRGAVGRRGALAPPPLLRNSRRLATSRHGNARAAVVDINHNAVQLQGGSRFCLRPDRLWWHAIHAGANVPFESKTGHCSCAPRAEHTHALLCQLRLSEQAAFSVVHALPEDVFPVLCQLERGSHIQFAALRSVPRRTRPNA